MSGEEGLENLAAHFPHAPSKGPVAGVVAMKPDLGEYSLFWMFDLLNLRRSGPKMYFASADRARQGSTRLHLDMTAAVNCMAWTESSDRSGADWLCFAAEDVDRLNEYLRNKYGIVDQQRNPVIEQNTFIDDDMLADLRRVNIIPFVIHQQAGQAVFIPAGVAHQVESLVACMKKVLCS